MGRVRAGDAAGGSRVLADYLDRYGDALLYDFAERGYRLADVVFGEGAWSPREILAFIRWLPDTSAFAACRTAEAVKAGDDAKGRGETPPTSKADQYAPENFQGWGRDRLLLAEIANHAQSAGIATIAVNTDKKNRSSIPKFEPTPTPFQTTPRRNLFEQLGRLARKKKRR